MTFGTRGEVTSTLESARTAYSYAGLARILILTFLCVTFFIGLVLVFIHELIPPVFALPIRKRFVR